MGGRAEGGATGSVNSLPRPKEGAGCFEGSAEDGGLVPGSWLISPPRPKEDGGAGSDTPLWGPLLLLLSFACVSSSRPPSRPNPDID